MPSRRAKSRVLDVAPTHIWVASKFTGIIQKCRGFSRTAVEIIFRADMANAEKIAERTKEYEDRFLSPFVAAERGYIDEVIMPHSTRKRLSRMLAMLRNKKLENPWKKHDNIPL